MPKAPHAMRYFYINPDQLASPCPLITGAEAGHIRLVLRLKPGDIIALADGAGFHYKAQILQITAEGVALKILEKFLAASESPVRISIAQALLKDRKMEDLIRPLSEIGIHRWIPFVAHRSVPRPEAKRTERSARWEKIAREALKQCRRGRILKIDPVVSFDQALELGKSCDLRIVFWENASEKLDPEKRNCGKPIRSIFAMLGPEGGFTEDEIQKAKTSGCLCVSLGPRILRAETATLAASSILQHLFGDLG